MNAVAAAPALSGFSAFNAFAPGLGARMRGYLLNGTDGAVLEEIAQIGLPPTYDSAAARKKTYEIRHAWVEGVLRRLPKHPAAQNPATLRRLGQLQQAFERQEAARERRYSAAPAGTAEHDSQGIWWIRPLDLDERIDWRNRAWAWLPYVLPYYTASEQRRFHLSLEVLAEAFTSDGLTREEFIAFFFAWSPDEYYPDRNAMELHRAIATAPGYAAFIRSAPGSILARLTAKSTRVRTEAMDMALNAGVTDPAVDAAIAALLQSSGKSARADGARAALRHPNGFDLALAALHAGSTSARADAAALAMQIDPARARPVVEAEALQAQHKSPALYEALMGVLDSDKAAEAGDVDAADAVPIPTYVRLPPAPKVASDADLESRPLPEQLAYHLRECIEFYREDDCLSSVARAVYWFGTDEELLSELPDESWPFDLRQWADALEAEGFAQDVILEQVLSGDCPPPSRNRVDDAIWPYFATRTDRLLAVLAIKPVDAAQKTAEAATLAILQTFPKLSPRFLASVTERAFGLSARAATPWLILLRRVEGSVEAVRTLLRSPKPERRGRAAQWLAEVGCIDALPNLMEGARKEKSAALRGTLLSAIIALGGDVSSFIDRATLDREADAVLARGIPKDWTWVPFDRLSLNWADGTPVRPQTLHAWMLQHLQAKSAIASGTTRAVMAGMDRGSGRALASMLVQWWMAGWVTLVTDAYLRTALEAELDKDDPQWRQYTSPERMETVVAEGKARFAGPDATHRGLLGFAAPLAGPETVALLRPLLAKAKADKRHQLMAALDFLSQLDAPSAVQAIVAVGQRFVSGTVRERAEGIVAALAQRKGWSRDELEDRSVPDLGLDAHGRAILDYGARQFTVQLTEAMELTLFAGGKPMKSLPRPGVQDDAALVKAAKATLSTMKGELKAVLAFQPMRLHAAMLSGRSWRFGEWQALVQQHPVLGRLAQRLVWLAEDGSTSFRPHADGAVLDATDAPAVLAAEARVIVAHALRMPEEAIAAWTQSFADYAVQPLFPQWGRTPLPALEPGQMELGGFRDWQMDSATLHNAATRRGWVRGPTGDGGSFDSYLRAFPTQKLELWLAFSGSYMSAGNIPVALASLSASSRGRGVPLAEVPDILLQEAYADMADIAASGPGYRKGWSAPFGV